MAKTDRPPITKDQLKALITAEISSALGTEGSALQSERTKAMDYYQGRPFGNEVDGRSQIVLTSVRDAIEWIMPTLMRIFAGGDQTVEFDPAQESDIPLAKQATEYVNFIWNKDNEGFLNFYSWFKDALLHKNGVIKIWWDDAELEKRERAYGLDDEAFAALVNDEDVTVSEHTENKDVELQVPQAPDPQTGQLIPQPPQKTTTHDVVITRKTPGGKVCISTVPPEEFLISKDGRNICDARLVGHRQRRTLSELRAQGVSEEILAKLGGADDTNAHTAEEIARNTVEQQTGGSAPIDNKAMTAVWVIECYIKCDMDGDGLAEMRKVEVAGPGYEIISDEAWDGARPFASLTPIIMPHRFVGLSIADMVKDIQLILSTIMRQYLDNLYASNNPTLEVVESDIVDPSEVLTRRPGGVIRVKRAGTVVSVPIPVIGRESLEGLEYISRIAEARTGVSERTQGLNADSLDKTATQARMMMSAAMGKIELIARVFAETGVKEAFRLILQLVCRYQQKARIVRLTDKFVPMDPRAWDEDMDVTVSVGMGTGDNDQKLQHSMLVGQAQQALMPLGMVKQEHLYNTFEMMINAMGLKGTDRFVQKPDPNQPPPPPPPNPKDQAAAARIQQQTQHDAEKHQAAMAQTQMQAGMDAHGHHADLQIQAAKVQADAQNQQQKTAQQAVLNMQQLYLKKWQIEQEINLKHEQMQAEIALKQDVADNVRLGGAPG